MFGLGSSELIIIAIIIFLLFGAKRLPEVGRGLGQAIKEFRKVKKEVSEESPRLTEENVSKGSQSKEGEIKGGQ